jgi:hypothetical protein
MVMIVVRHLAGQNRGNHEHERDEAGGASFDSEDSGSFPSSDDSPGGRYVVVSTTPTFCRFSMLVVLDWEPLSSANYKIQVPVEL